MIINESVIEDNDVYQPHFSYEVAECYNIVKRVNVFDTLDFNDEIDSRFTTIVRNNAVDTLSFSEAVIVRNVTKRFLVSDQLAFNEFNFLAGRTHRFLVSDTIVFADSVYNWRKFAQANDSIVFAESASIRHAIIRIMVIEELAFTEQVFRIVTLNKQALSGLDTLVFNESGIYDYQFQPRIDTLVFGETVDAWKLKNRPIATEKLTFAETSSIVKVKRAPSDTLVFQENVCLCLTLNRIATDTLSFDEAVRLNTPASLPPLGEGPFRWRNKWNRIRGDELELVESIGLLVNNENPFTRECCA